jgi:rhodanese-related sulfurtransferase
MRGVAYSVAMRANVFRITVSGILAGLSLLAACETRVTDTDIEYVNTPTVRRLIDDESASLLLIDPRAPEDYAAAHLPGARNIQLTDVPENGVLRVRIDGYRHMIVYGDSPTSAPARAMTKRLIAIGYERVRMYFGGLSEWIESGYETESGPPAE